MRASVLSFRHALIPVLLAASGCDWFVDAQTRVDRAERHIAAAEYRGAMIELRNAVQAAPDNARAHLLLAQVSLQLGDPAGADHELRRALELGTPRSEAADLGARIRLAMSQHAELLAEIDGGEIELSEPARSVYRGQALHGLKREEEAATAFGTALAVDAESAPARAGLAEVYAAQGDFTRALAEIDAVTERNPDFAYAWLVRGNVLAGRGQFAAAEQALQTALERAAEQLSLQQRAGLLAALTQTKLARGDLDGADAVHRQITALAPDAAMTRFMGARIAMARQDYPAAIAELQRILNAVPDFLPGRFLLGGALLANGSLEQAEQQLAQVVQDAPENVEARKLLAQVRLRLDRPEAAMRVLVPALEAESPDPQLRVLMDTAQAQLGEVSGALTLLERSVASHPDNDDLKLSLAAAYLRNGQSGKAIEVLNRTKGRARLALARVYLQNKQTRKADEVISQVLAAAPERADIAALVGLLYLEAGRYEQALAHLRAAADRQPANPGYWLNVARAQLVLDQPGAAREAVDKALTLRADWLPAIAMAAMLEVRAGRHELALARVVGLKEKHPRDAQILLLEGEILAAAKQYAAAAEAFAAAGRLRPSAMLALKAYGARQMAGLADAAEPLQRWLQREPDDLIVRTALAQAYSQAEPAKAIEEYERILQRAPTTALAINNLAWLYHAAGDTRALETARRAHELAPSVPAITDTYGWILLQNGQMNQALPLLKAAAAASDNPEIASHYAEALHQSRAGAGPRR